MGIILGSALFFGPRLAMAQGAGVPGITAANVPVLASGQSPSVTPGMEEEPPNLLAASLSVGANYDDNAVPDISPRQWDVQYSILPKISLQETRSRIAWGLSYGPGLALSQNLLYRNYFSQTFGGDLAWQVSPHGTFSAQQYYLATTNPFAGFTTTQPGPAISPNETIYIPNVHQTLILSNAMYSYRSSAQTTMGVGGSFDRQQYDTIPNTGPSTELIHFQIASGDAFIARQLTARNQLGFQYGLQVLRFPQADARTTSHSFLIFDQMNLSSSTTITLYGGPEYSLTANQVALNLGFIVVTIPVNANQWSAEGGVMYNWTGNRLATAIDFTRRVSDGGGLLGAVELTAGTAQLSYRLNRNWSLTSSISGADDQLLASSSGNNELKTYGAQFGIRRLLWQKLALSWFYQRLNETGSVNGLILGNRDIAGTTLEYTFSKPLGGG